MMRQMRVVERRVTGLAAKSNEIRQMGKMDMQRKANDPWSRKGKQNKDHGDFDSLAGEIVTVGS